MEFSIIIPSWNNLSFLKLCIHSVKSNSAFEHEIVIHVNEGSDGTVAWLEDEGISFSYSKENIGVCDAVNTAYKKCTKPYIVYMNDDMYACPNWDTALIAQIQLKDSNKFYLSSTLIEPAGNNPVVQHANFGSDPDSFQEKELLSQFSKLYSDHWNGASWPPSLMHRELWDKIGGFSPEYFPGMYSDPDISRKLWEEGVRDFQGVGDSLVYHFSKQSTGRVVKNDGSRTFLKKWGITSRTFYTYYLEMGKKYRGPLDEARIPFFELLRNKMKYLIK